MEYREIREENANVLVRSEKIPQKKKKMIIWIISALLVITTLTFLVIDYSDYKKGQEFGLASAATVLYWVNPKDSYAKQCKDVYNELNRKTYDRKINGVTIDLSDTRELEAKLRDAFANLMKAAGFDRYSSFNIANWFKYTNIAEYFLGCYSKKILSICCYVVLLVAIVFTISVNNEEKKELIVYDSYVLCKINPQKTKQLFFEDITNIGIEKNTLKIAGVGVEYRIFNLTNAESMKDVITEKKKSVQDKLDSSNISNADELKKYKELLDSGTITQEEFDAKKRQILKL